MGDIGPLRRRDKRVAKRIKGRVCEGKKIA